ncbi:hypothetical protein PIB30_031232 [Stylosanthes scabra]|uniref:Uncharacterized protein n=1 Tax=Stylosanthes scabra TaxID=79078 RepID=A0ABU6UB80_9FABA|nr:hypothetical protein [Stylosanthes scabra]
MCSASARVERDTNDGAGRGGNDGGHGFVYAVVICLHRRDAEAAAAKLAADGTTTRTRPTEDNAMSGHGLGDTCGDGEGAAAKEGRRGPAVLGVFVILSMFEMKKG